MLASEQRAKLPLKFRLAHLQARRWRGEQCSTAPGPSRRGPPDAMTVTGRGTRWQAPTTAYGAMGQTRCALTLPWKMFAET